MAKGLNRLEELAKGQESTWQQEAEWRQTNRGWLERSTEIAIRILSEMNEKGMSQKELAQRMNVSPQYINKMLKGKENLSLETISRIEQALNIRLISIAYQTCSRVELPSKLFNDYRGPMREYWGSIDNKSFVPYRDEIKNNNGRVA
jgi:transcriptional regulator with XRE-family HTH domain